MSLINKYYLNNLYEKIIVVVYKQYNHANVLSFQYIL